jgi:hypothetical protein
MIWLYWARLPFGVLLVAAVCWLAWLAWEYEQ